MACVIFVPFIFCLHTCCLFYSVREYVIVELSGWKGEGSECFSPKSRDAILNRNNKSGGSIYITNKVMKVWGVACFVCMIDSPILFNSPVNLSAFLTSFNFNLIIFALKKYEKVAKKKKNSQTWGSWFQNVDYTWVLLSRILNHFKIF